MKNKAPLALIELVVMLLIFALAAGVCLQVFVWSEQRSEEIALQDEAVLQVQNVAEVLKAGRGDLEILEDEISGAAAITTLGDGSGVEILRENMSVEVALLETNSRELGAAAVTAKELNGKELFRVEVYWQEPLEGGAGRE